LSFSERTRDRTASAARVSERDSAKAIAVPTAMVTIRRTIPSVRADE